MNALRTLLSRLLEASRKQNPKRWVLVDKIAPIIDPSAWPGEAYDGTGPDAKPINWDENPEVQWRRSEAQQRAGAVLDALGIEPAREFDWAEFFRSQRGESDKERST
jgi:hypothetical protein